MLTVLVVVMDLNNVGVVDPGGCLCLTLNGTLPSPFLARGAKCYSVGKQLITGEFVLLTTDRWPMSPVSQGSGRQ